MDENEASELFNEVYKEIAGVMGKEAAIELHRMYKGQQITFPVHLYNSKSIQSVIVKEYDGTNIRELARKYDYSEKTVRRMIKDRIG